MEISKLVTKKISPDGLSLLNQGVSGERSKAGTKKKELPTAYHNLIKMQ